MKILFINETCGTGSHGNICVEQARQWEAEGHICRIAYGRNTFVPKESADLAVQIGNKRDVYVHAIKSRLFDQHGFGSGRATERFLQWAEEYDPDLVWIHNIHGYYIHVGRLFEWIKRRPAMTVRWTLHDCWAFTGHCAHYMSIPCEKWKVQCEHCPGLTQYPKSILFDRSKQNYEKKRELFSGVSQMTLYVPSDWLMGEVKESFLGKYPIIVNHNTVDLNTYCPTPKPELEAKLRKKYELDESKIILGVAGKWTTKKGFEDFLKLSTILDEHTYQIVLVGVDEKQKRIIDTKGTGILHTENKEELAQLYRMAEVYVNLTYEENYPTVNMEAEACGTDVICYDAGGSRETIHRKTSAMVAVGDLEMVAELIRKR